MGRKICLILCVCLALLSACRSEPVRPPDAPEKISLQIAVGGQAQFIYLPLTLAEQLGLFKKHGLQVTIVDTKGGSEALAALMGGSADIVLGFYEHTIRVQVQGKRLTMIALFDRFPGLVLMVGKRHVNAVHSIRDLVGKPVGVTAPGSTTDQMLKYLLRQNELDPQSIPVVTGGTTTMIAALEQDRVWAGVTVDPVASKLETDGTAIALYDTRTEEGTTRVFGGSWPAGGFYTTSEFVKQNPRTVQALANVAVEILRYIHHHSAEEIAAQVPESFLSGGKDLYLASLKKNLAMYSTDGVIPADGAENVLKALTLVDEKISRDKVDLQRTYDNSFVIRAAQLIDK